jgi:hypothetical protein
MWRYLRELWQGYFLCDPSRLGCINSSLLSLEGGTECGRAHAGFLLNLRATWLPVLDELNAAFAGRSLLDHDRPVAHPAETLYLTGHSLGGAMAALFALMVAGNSRCRLATTQRAIPSCLRLYHRPSSSDADAVPTPVLAPAGCGGNQGRLVN